MTSPGVLVVLPNWVGDGALAAPALRAVVAARPGARLVLLGTERSAPLYGRWPADALLVFQGPGVGALVRIARKLRLLGIGEALILPPSFRAAFLTLLAGIPRRIGFATDGRRALLTDPLPPPGREDHLARQYLALTSRWGGDRGGEIDPTLPIGEDEIEAEGDRLAGLGIDGTRTIGLCPGATYGETKRWPAAHWIRLGRTLTAAGWSVLLIGGSAEREIGRQLHTGIGPKAIDLTGQLRLRESLALFRCLAGAVSNDSGAMHLAAAAGCPVVGLFGSTNPAWTGPLGLRSRSISLALACSPCYGRTCPTQIECLRDLDPPRVAGALETLLGPLEANR